MPVKLTIATTDYDHFRDFRLGLVRAEGIDATWLTLGHHEIFSRFTFNREWDVSELSFAKFSAQVTRQDSDVIGLPVYASRLFRFASFYVNKKAGIKSAADLKGKRIGVPEWAHTAAVWMRGWLMHEGGVPLAGIEWVQAGTNEAGREEKVEFSLPKGILYQQRRDTSISALLLSGEIDAAISARVPEAYYKGKGKVVRLYPNYRPEEMRYFAATGIFPIMHIIAMRRAVFERYPWVAMNMFKAFDKAKARSLERIRDLTASRIPVPWSASIVAEWGASFGADPFPYGLEANRKTLDAFCRFAHAQGLTAQRLTPDELFPEEVRASVRV